MAPSIDKDTIDRETDARFWAQTAYKPGQKLDPNNPTDKPYMAVWKDLHHKVKAEAKAGTLVTTFDHPEVAQHLSDATVANKAAAAHADIAAAAPDPATAQEHAVAATTASQISAHKAREAAAKQPPTVSPKLVQAAGKEAIKTPPPPNAPAADHIAHVQALKHAHGHHLPASPQAQARAAAQRPRPPVLSREALYREALSRFWHHMHYRPGQQPNMADARERQIWAAIMQQVQHEAAAAPQFQAPPPQPYPYPYPYPQGPSLQPPAAPSMQPSYPQPPTGPHGHGHGHHHHGQQATMGPTSAPDGGSGAPPAAQDDVSDVPSEDAPGAPSPDAGLPDAPPPPPDATDSALPSAFQSEGPSPIGKAIAIGAAVIASGGLIYFVTKHKPPHSKHKHPRGAHASPAFAGAFPPARAARS